MSMWFWTMVAAGISFACGWGVARHSREPASGIAAPADFAGGVMLRPPPAAAAAASLEPAQNELPARELFLVQLRRLNKPVDGRGFYEWAQTVSLDELEGVIASLGHSPEPSSEIRQLISVLAGRDPKAALRRFAEWTEFGRSQLIDALVAGWARHDPRASLEWLATQRNNAATDEAREAAFRRWAQSDPQAALAALREKGWQWDSPKSIQSIFLAWVRRDPQRALSEWRRMRQEFNPPIAPGAESSLDPFTIELVAGLAGHAKIAKQEEPIAATFEWFEPGEVPQVPASFWHQLLMTSDPETVLPKLEDRLEFSKMKQVLALLLRDAPEKRQSILSALKNSELRVEFESIPPDVPPAWSSSPFGPEGKGETGGGEGAGFWDRSIKLNP